MGTGLKTGESLKTRERQKTGKPPMYKVLLLNDDYTTMDFVVFILERIFHKPPAEAARIMLLVHRQGAGLAGVYTRDIAQTKIREVHGLARENEYPLRCIMENE